jgi:methylated-DNA-[protein]-cysteine S-methyltransferase
LGSTAVTAQHAGQRRAATAYCYWDLVPSPFRSLCVAVDGDGRLVEIRFDGHRPEGRRDAKRCRDAAAQLGEYFAGRRRAFELALAPYGTDFQLRVWHALCEIPYGAVRTYGDIARAIGQPTATRAVGQANGSNPLPIVVPCHRVLASDGSIGGYSAGLDIKHRLLALEGVELDL